MLTLIAGCFIGGALKGYTCSLTAFYKRVGVFNHV